MILKGMNSDVLTFSTTVLSHASSINSLEEKRGQATTLVYANTYESELSNSKGNQRNSLHVSTIITRSGKALQEIIRPDKFNVQELIDDNESPKEMDKAQEKEAR
ncbi:hypothetical protein R3W88_022681 [Solanum pinnatisectum]|uniref:Uncharacterized protein n=1 Tax=Solanum pinnatisectum TaxID=50273 RepID=A0AAV9LW63_9SOLN|nr:hypothetical protein R3W88_022681 [Solanum pinnatisectum]